MQPAAAAASRRALPQAHPAPALPLRQQRSCRGTDQGRWRLWLPPRSGPCPRPIRTRSRGPTARRREGLPNRPPTLSLREHQGPGWCRATVGRYSCEG